MATAPMDNPLFAGRALTPLSTWSEPPEQPKRRQVPPIIGEIIGKLGLRYRPLSGAVDLEAHAEALILLAEDCADMPAPLLDEAARKWARDSKWMPKASELRELARELRSEAVKGSDFAGQQLQDHCDKTNALDWVIASGDPYVVVMGQSGKREITRRSNTRKMTTERPAKAA